MKKKTVTSSEVKQRWEAKAYKKYMVRLRWDSDDELIAYVEDQKRAGIQISELVREGLKKLKNEDGQ